MTITLPTYPRPTEDVEFEVLDRTGSTSPAVGGKLQLKRRVGDRLQITVTLPRMDHDGARAWLAAKLNSATTGETVTWTWPLAEDEGAGVGAPLVDGAAQMGPTLNLKGLTPALVIKALTPLSFLISGRNFTYLTRAESTVGGDGKVALPIGPLLRAPPADNTAVEFLAPKIEGLFEGPVSWSMVQLCNIGVTFVLYENE